MTLSIGCIVEGHGEVRAVRILLRRLAEQRDPSPCLNVLQPWRVARQKFVKPGELERVVESIARRLAPPRAILILLDADDDCPKELAPALLARAAATRPDIPMHVVLAKREFEAWFLAAAESLRGRRDLPADFAPPEDPEAIRGAKEYLTRSMPPGRSYSETVDQAALTAGFDLEAARGCDSFEKCCREIERILALAAAAGLENGPQNG